MACSGDVSLSAAEPLALVPQQGLGRQMRREHGPMEAEEAEAGASPLDRPRHAAPSGMVSLQPGSQTRFPLVPGV